MGLFTKKKTTHDGPVRVRPPELGGASVVRHPASGHYVTPDPDKVYAPDHALVVAFPWMFISDADLLAIRQQSGGTKSVSLAELDRDPLELMREAVDAELAASRSRTPAEHADAAQDQVLAAFGIAYGEDENGAHVTFTTPIDPHQDEKLYQRTDMEWISIFGLQAALTATSTSRTDRAMALARAGKLTQAEREHLAYIAEAAQPVDAVKPTTPPLTSQQARDILAAAANVAPARQAELFEPSDQIRRQFKSWE